MRNRSSRWIHRSLVLVFATALNLPQPAQADDASILPQGVSCGYRDFYHYLPTTQRYNADGDLEGLAHPKLDTRWLVAGMTLLF